MMINKRFQNKVIVLFGGAKGIGKDIAEAFAVEGGNVFIVDIDTNMGYKVAESAQQQGLAITFLKADITNEQEIYQITIKIFKQCQKIDVLINNVRGPRDRADKPLEYSLTQWMDSIKYILGGTYLTCKNLIPKMIQQKEGVIINIASISASYIGEESASYHTAKAGLIQFSKYLADKYGQYQIRVNCVSPGFILHEEHITRFNEANNLNYRETAFLTHPLKRVGNTADVAKLVLYLASPDASFITGQNITIDGGLTIRDQWAVANQIRINNQK